jgi:hypothetical protein
VRLEFGRGGAVPAYSGEERRGWLDGHEEEERKQARMQGVWAAFIATGRSVEEEGSRSMHMAVFKTTGGAGGISGERGSCSGPMAQRGRARGGQRGQLGRWEEGWGDAWSKIRATQSSRGSGSGWRQRSRAAVEELRSVS